MVPPEYKDYTKDELVKTALEQWYEIQALKKVIYGESSERFVSKEEKAEKGSKEGVELEHINYTRKKRQQEETQPKRGILDKLPTEDIIIEPDFEIEGLTYVGDVVTRIIDYKPGKLFVKRIIRRKYVKQGEDDKSEFQIAPLPELPLPKAMVGPGLLSYLIVSKYVDHLPYYRQIKILRRYGADISDSTINDWIKSVYKLLSLLYDRLGRRIRESNYLQVDETTLKVLDKAKKGKTHTGYLWLCHAVNEKLVYIQYDPSRSGEAARNLLGNFRGCLQTDYYSAYEQFDSVEGITMYACMAHIRRKFIEAFEIEKTPLSSILVGIQWLYAVEEHAKYLKLTDGERAKLRKKQSEPMLKAIKTWLDENQDSYLPKSKQELLLHTLQIFGQEQ